MVISNDPRPARGRFPGRLHHPFSWAVGTIVLAALLAYANSFSGPFIFDDLKSIPQNPSIRHLDGFMAVFSPPLVEGETVGNRPLLDLSFALNYALGGNHVCGYHAANLLIHVLAALTLFGLARRTFLQPLLRDLCGRDALLLGWAVALLWVVHPLQTESVTYIVQRAESLAGLLYLLTLYCFVRATQADRPQRWFLLSLACCYLAVGIKEVIATAPLLVLLYDRTFITGNFVETWRRRRAYYLGLAGTWVILAVMIAVVGSRGETVGAVVGVTWQVYALSQFPAVVHYLVLSLWPHPLVINYGPSWIRDPWRAAPFAVAIFLLLALTLPALRRAPTTARKWPALGFLGAWFFLILAPTSSVIPEKDAMFEHRMYLPLAAVLMGLVLIAHRFLGRRGLGVGLLLVTPVLIATTLARNHDYRSSLAMWTDCVAKRPLNTRARNNLGLAFAQLNRLPEAIAQYRQVLAIDPTKLETYCNLGAALDRQGRGRDAVEQYRQALALDPKTAHAWCNWGVVLAQQGHSAEATAMFEKAAQLDPNYAEAQNNLGVARDDQGRMVEAIAHFETAVRIDPDYLDGYNNLGDALGAAGRFTEAIHAYQAALQIDPANVSAHYNMGVALTELRRFPEAAAQDEAVLRVDPQNANARANLVKVRAFLGTGEGR